MSTATEHEVERVARAILAANGAPDPHPALLADTIREVDYHGIPAQYRPEPVTEPVPEWQVVKNEYDLPCEHPGCDLVHRHLYNATYDAPVLVTVYDMRGEHIVGSRWETRYHVKHRTEWVILHHGERVGNAHDTKREALAEMATHPTI